MNGQQITEQIRQTKEKKITIYPCNNLRASNIGHPCERYLYLLIKHWDEQATYDVGLQYIFDLGSHLEGYVIDTLKEAGYECVTPTVRSWKVENPLITGREDLRIKTENGDFIPVEVKGISPYEWDKLNSVEDFFRSRKHYIRAYPAQLLIYEWKFGKENGMFALLNKLTGQIKLIDVPFDWDRADELLKKGERIYKHLQDGTLPAACDDVTVCESCNLRHICPAAIERPEAEIDDGELQELIEKKARLKAAYDEYNETHEEIKKAMADRDSVITGDYIVQAKIINKSEYVVPARQERRITIKKL